MVAGEVADRLAKPGHVQLVLAVAGANLGTGAQQDSREPARFGGPDVDAVAARASACVGGLAAALSVGSSPSAGSRAPPRTANFDQIPGTGFRP